jgi:hypothetical protein
MRDVKFFCKAVAVIFAAFGLVLPLLLRLCLETWQFILR